MPITLITGAASGIRAAPARLLAARGHELILMDQDADGLAALPAGRRIVGDVADPALWIEAELTGLTNAVINAGIGAGGPIEDMTLGEWRQVMNVNLDGAFLSLQAAMRAIRAADYAGDEPGGAIVVTASVAGVKPEPGIAAYAASKAAVIQLAKVAAKEGAAARIRVNAIAPGGVETPIWGKQPFFQELIAAKGSEEAAYAALAGLATPLGRYARPDEIAAQIAFLLSDDCAFTTGSVLITDGGYSL